MYYFCRGALPDPPFLSSFPCSANHDERDGPPCKIVFQVGGPSMAINISVRYNGRLLPEILLTLCDCF